ncbi:uncharacterized protein PAC_15628 [Phialocephala subalpina]|uniref:2EXR domain-containing protein n=1 Tax=Phialocephala subalpina TaxID=576137 RepID=A0A1L7XL32_9HELO|nr:uncharacterized protein PAC_15628 [Phialocephala subalpina]
MTTIQHTTFFGSGRHSRWEPPPSHSPSDPGSPSIHEEDNNLVFTLSSTLAQKSAAVIKSTPKPSALCSSQSTPSFPKFSKLPTELRLQIWNHALTCQPSRTISLEASSRTPWSALSFHPQKSPVPLLTTCYESREVAKTRYRKGFYNMYLIPKTDLQFVKSHVLPGSNGMPLPVVHHLNLHRVVDEDVDLVAVLFSPTLMDAPRPWMRKEAEALVEIVHALASCGASQLNVWIVIQDADKQGEEGRKLVENMRDAVDEHLGDYLEEVEMAGLKVLPELGVVMGPFAEDVDEWLFVGMESEIWMA